MSLVTFQVDDLATEPVGFRITSNVDANFSYGRVTANGVVDPYVLDVTAGGVPKTVLTGFTTGKGLHLVWGSEANAPHDLSGVYRVTVTDGLDPVATRSRQVIADRIRLLDLPVYVYEQWNTTDLSNVNYPCVTTEGMTESREKSFNQTDDVGRPVAVEFCDRESSALHDKLPFWERVRTRIERAFHNEQLDMPESVLCRVEFGTITDRDLPHMQFMLSKLVIRHITREYRGLGV